MLILARCAGEWDQYRFLPIDSATAVADLAGEGAAIQKMGAVQLDLGASLRARAAVVVPATLSLGNGADELASL